MGRGKAKNRLGNVVWRGTMHRFRDWSQCDRGDYVSFNRCRVLSSLTTQECRQLELGTDGSSNGVRAVRRARWARMESADKARAG